MRVLGIAGSARRGSNTDILLDEVLKGAVSRGAETKTIIVPNLNIVACQDCGACSSTGNCPFGDDMVRVHQDLTWADRLVLAAPLHFMGLPSQTKALIDRTQGLWVKKYLLKQPPLGDSRARRGLFVSAGGRIGEHLFDGALTTVKAFFASLDVEYAGIVACAGMEKRAEISAHPEVLAKALAAGEELVEPQSRSL